MVLRPVKSSKRLPGNGHVFIEQPNLLWMPSVSKAFVSLSCVKETLPVWNVFHKTEHVKWTGSWCQAIILSELKNVNYVTESRIQCPSASLWDTGLSVHEYPLLRHHNLMLGSKQSLKLGSPLLGLCSSIVWLQKGEHATCVWEKLHTAVRFVEFWKFISIKLSTENNTGYNGGEALESWKNYLTKSFISFLFSDWSDQSGWKGYACIAQREVINAYRILVGMPERNRPCGRCRCK